MSDTIPLSEVPEDIGRNDPCPCGSGRKYKKCCQRAHRLQKEAQKRSRSIEDLVDPDMNAWGITKLLRQMNDNKMYALFYDLAHPEGPFSERYDSKAAFLKAADQGEAQVPGGPDYDLRRIRLDEGLDYVLLTRGLDDPRSETYDYQVVTLRRNDVDAAGEPRDAEHPGLRVWDVAHHQRAKADLDDGDLTLADLGYTWGQHRE